MFNKKILNYRNVFLLALCTLVMFKGNGTVVSKFFILVFLFCFFKTIKYLIKGLKVIAREGIINAYKSTDDYKPKRTWIYVFLGFVSIMFSLYFK